MQKLFPVKILANQNLKKKQNDVKKHTLEGAKHQNVLCSAIRRLRLQVLFMKVGFPTEKYTFWLNF